MEILACSMERDKERRATRTRAETDARGRNKDKERSKGKKKKKKERERSSGREQAYKDAQKVSLMSTSCALINSRSPLENSYSTLMTFSVLIDTCISHFQK